MDRRTKRRLNRKCVFVAPGEYFTLDARMLIGRMLRIERRTFKEFQRTTTHYELATLVEREAPEGTWFSFRQGRHKII